MENDFSSNRSVAIFKLEMKTPLVLISGLLSNESVWKHQIEHLSEIAEIQVFSPSEKRAEKMLEEILKKAPPKFALAGHSMGGWLCLELLRVAPSRVTKVCLLNTSARDDSKEKQAKRKQMILRAKEGEFKKITSEIAAFFTQDRSLQEKLEKMFLIVGCQAFISQEKAMLNRKSCEDVLPTINCPALVIHAAQDRNFSFEEHLEMAQKIPNAKLAVVEDSGHMSPLEMPQAVTSLLRFWMTYFG